MIDDGQLAFTYKPQNSPVMVWSITEALVGNGQWEFTKVTIMNVWSELTIMNVWTDMSSNW